MKTVKDCDPSKGFTEAAEKAHTLPRAIIYSSSMKQGADVTWTYDVEWTQSNIQWASRWDIYLSMGNRFSDEIHWFAIINSLIIAVFLTVSLLSAASVCPLRLTACNNPRLLSAWLIVCCAVLWLQGLVAMILIRALHRDLSRYNRVATDEEKAEDKEETGWKLVHGDVFRPPTKAPLMFAAFVGVGCQVRRVCWHRVLHLPPHHGPVDAFCCCTLSLCCMLARSDGSVVLLLTLARFWACAS